MPGSRSIGYIASKVAVLCGMVCFFTCLTGRVSIFWVSLGSVIVIVVVVFIDVAVQIRVVGVTVFVSRIILNAFNLFSLFFNNRH